MLGWAGMRGVVTLAAAFVIPEDTPHREVLLLMAFTVVAGTLFIQGMSLPWLARRLRVPGPDPAEDALARATLLQQASKAALHRLDELEYDDSQGVVDLIRQRLDQRNFAAWERLGTVADRESPSDLYARIRLVDARGRARAGARDPRRRHRRLRGGRRRAGHARRRGVDARHRHRGAPRAAGVRRRPAYRRHLRRPRALPGRRDRRRPGLPGAASTKGSSGSRCASASSAATSPAATPRSASTPPSTSTRPPTRSWSPPSPARTGAGATCTTRRPDQGSAPGELGDLLGSECFR